MWLRWWHALWDRRNHRKCRRLGGGGSVIFVWVAPFAGTVMCMGGVAVILHERSRGDLYGNGRATAVICVAGPAVIAA